MKLFWVFLVAMGCAWGDQRDVAASFFGEEVAAGWDCCWTDWAQVVYLEERCGWLYHVAEYADGKRVVTCLDGPMRGYQAIGYWGWIFYESYAVSWGFGCFTHYYWDRTVYSDYGQQYMIVN